MARSFLPKEKVQRLKQGGLVLLIALGLSQPLGYVAGFRGLRNFGSATALSPLPLDDSAVDGKEHFTSSLLVTALDKTGDTLFLPVTGKLFSQVHGPFVRRSLYARAISLIPTFSEAARQTILRSFLCPGGTLASDFGLPNELREVTLRVETKTLEQPDITETRVACNL